VWEQIEKPLLNDLFAEYGGRELSCLDFACGTGRITSLLEPVFGRVTGLDISSDMLAEARSKCPSSEFVHGDLTVDETLVGEFDVVTSFRFFPNAEAGLRVRAMEVLTQHVKPGGTMIVNNHQNACSLLGRIRSFSPGSRREFMKPDELPSLLERFGLQVERTIGFAFIPVWRDWAVIPVGVRVGIEKKLVTEGRGLTMALNLVHVAKKPKG
jgi:SAM-dependent methyltransferase